MMKDREPRSIDCMGVGCLGALAVGLLSLLGNLNYDQEVLWVQRLVHNPTTTPGAMVAYAAIEQSLVLDTHPTATDVPTPLPYEFANPSGWDCEVVNNPDAPSFDPSLPPAPTASDVLALPDIGKQGVDGPPYLKVDHDGSISGFASLDDLDTVFNGDHICAREP